MDKEQLRMQMLAGVITEGEYKAKLEENDSTENKDSLNENFVGMSAINSPFAKREKESYEDAFEHFLSERYETKFENREQDVNEEIGEGMEKEELITKIKNLGDFGFTGDEIEFNSLLITCSTQEDNEETPYYFVYGEDDESEDGIFSSTNPEEVAEFVLNY
jgi:hypothetical protein